MTNFQNEPYNLSQMTEDEKNELIIKLTAAYNEQQVATVSLYNAMVVLAQVLMANDVLGRRAKVMRLVAGRMAMVARLTLQHIGWDVKEEQVDSTFETIVAGLDLEFDENDKDEKDE